MNRDFANNYIDIVIEYIDKMNTSAFIRAQSDRIFLIQSGFKAITHVFILHYINTNDLEGAFYNSQKGYILYLEYLEQMHQTNMSHDLNHTDAIQFVYNKTISDFTITNLAKISDNTILDIVRTTELILWFENTGVNQINITKRLIIGLLKHDIYEYIDIAHKRKMTNDEYAVFLTETLSLFNKSKKKFIWNNVALHIIQHWDEHANMPIKQWCKWLKSPGV
jgi:hypothetical protein